MNYFDQVGHEILQNKYFFLHFSKIRKGNFFLKNHLFLERKMHISWKRHK